MLRIVSRAYSSVCRPPHIQAFKYLNNDALTDLRTTYTYKSIVEKSHRLAEEIRKHHQGRTLEGERIAYLVPNDASSVVTKWAIWLNKAIAVPLCITHPLEEKQYFVDDSQSKLVIGTNQYRDEVTALSNKSTAAKLVIDDSDQWTQESQPSSNVGEEEYNGPGISTAQKALIIYTSGTTGRPKGVVLTHGNIDATTRDMAECWEWSQTDTSLHVLPLHHIHGLINALHVPLSVGARCLMLPRFSAEQVWKQIVNPASGVTVLTAVPTVYAKLLEYYESGVDPSLTPDVVKRAASKIRLMISGSSALPLPLRDTWSKLTTHTLLERYGMSEILMALTNPLYGKRLAGTVGLPFKSVKTIIAREDTTAPHGYVDVTNDKSAESPGFSPEGELYVKGPTVFSEYFNKPEATKETFTSDGWFKTGDTVCIDSDGYYKILGRTSVDIIKSGGFKISALDIESKLLLHSSIAECSVVGKHDKVYGQQVAALVVVKPGHSLTDTQIIDWCKDKMPKYHIPRTVTILDSIPKNAMGKVNKKMLLKQYYPPES